MYLVKFNIYASFQGNRNMFNHLLLSGRDQVSGLPTKKAKLVLTTIPIDQMSCGTKSLKSPPFVLPIIEN